MGNRNVVTNVKVQRKTATSALALVIHCVISRHMEGSCERRERETEGVVEGGKMQLKFRLHVYNTSVRKLKSKKTKTKQNKTKTPYCAKLCKETSLSWVQKT